MGNFVDLLWYLQYHPPNLKHSSDCSAYKKSEHSTRLASFNCSYTVLKALYALCGLPRNIILIRPWLILMIIWLATSSMKMWLSTIGRHIDLVLRLLEARAQAECQDLEWYPSGKKIHGKSPLLPPPKKTFNNWLTQTSYAASLQLSKGLQGTNWTTELITLLRQKYFHQVEKKCKHFVTNAMCCWSL